MTTTGRKVSASTRQYYHCQHGVNRQFCTICKGRFLPEFRTPEIDAEIAEDDAKLDHYEAVRELFLQLYRTSYGCMEDRSSPTQIWDCAELAINFAESKRPK